MEETAAVPSSSVGPGQIRFADACLPALAAGDYRLRMNQEVRAAPLVPLPMHSVPYASELLFSVDGPRFRLEPADIHATYPPPGAAGAFADALPHVVFTRRTLPWERTLDGGPQGDPPRPWLAVLLLGEDELLAGVEQGEGRAVAACVPPRPLPVCGGADGKEDSLLFARDPQGRSLARVRVPALGQEGPDHERLLARHAGERCQALDLPANLFAAIAPRDVDLPWLAHARLIDTGDKEIFRGHDQGWYAVAIGNRMPAAGGAHHAFLVSLEGFADVLADFSRLDGYTSVRLAVLASWRFECVGKGDFKARMRGLDAGAFERARIAGERAGSEGAGTERTAAGVDAWLHLPLPEPALAAESAPARLPGEAPTPAALVHGALARGYAAFDHRLRHGERTVSWYRGPLVPLEYPQPRLVQRLVRCSDELLRYDPECGMFDTAYAGAWQLGRLLALQNRGFVLALERARLGLRRRLAELRHAARLASLVRCAGVRGEPDDGGRPGRLREALALACAEAIEAGVGAGRAGLGPGPTPIAPAASAPTAAPVLRATELEAMLAEASAWLGRLVLLYGVPLHNLVPDEDMLPPETLRFFFLDPNWIQALVQGACSVGNADCGDLLVNRVMRFCLSPTVGDPAAETDLPIEVGAAGEAGRAAASVRARLRAECEGRATASAKASEKVSEKASTASPAGLAWPLGGFLLRSAVVEGWRGLEVEAWQGGNKLPALRIEQLADDVMLALFNGMPDTVEIRQPREGLHFGLSPTVGGSGFTRTRRDPQTGAALVGRPIDVPMRGVPEPGANVLGAPGVIDIDALAGVLRPVSAPGVAPTASASAPAAAGGAVPDGVVAAQPFGPGAFAMQMIEAAGAFRFQIVAGGARVG